MKLLNAKARLLLCGLIIAAFFLPSYMDVSGFSFIRLAFSEADANSELTQTDILITVIPLLLIPGSALFILIRSIIQLPTRKTYTALPLIFLSFFLAVLLLTSGNSSSDFSSPAVLLQMQAGFYVAGIASFILVFTKNSRKKRRRRRVSSSEIIAPAEAFNVV